MNGTTNPGRNIIVVTVLLLAMLLPIVLVLSNFQDTPTISAGVQIETATQSATPMLASETPRPAPLSNAVKAASPAQGTNCTYPATYWLVSPEIWPAEVTIGNLYYTQEQAIEFVAARPTEMFNILFIQLHVAYLNILSGAAQSEILEPMITASDWLNKSLHGSNAGQPEQQEAIYLAMVIQAYNDGKIGPGRCPMETTSLNLFSDEISAAALSLTPDISIEATPTNSPALQTPVTGIRTPTFNVSPPASTATMTPTREDDSGPAPIPPTPIPTLQPTATSAPPTPIPTLQPTATSAPPTPRPTSPPPTATPQPAEPTPTSAPAEEPTPTSPPP